MKLDALHLVAPHGRMAAEGEKRMVVKSRKFDVSGKTYWIASDGKIHGTIELDNPKDLSLADFKRKDARHLITDDERREWWPDADQLYAYKVTRIHRLKTPRPYAIPKGAQTFVKDVDLDVDGRDFVGGIPEALQAGDSGDAEEFADGMTLDMMYLVEPFAGMVYNGEKTVLLKGKPFDIEGKRYWLAGNLVYGIVKWGNQRKISMEQFRDLAIKHRATEAQRRRWWPDKAELWAYDLQSMRRLREPYDWWKKRERGNRVFIENVTLPLAGKDFYPDGTKPQTGVLASIQAADLKPISDRDLLSKRLRMHQLWATTGGQIRGLTRDGFIEKHALVVKEMKRRGLERRTISDLDRATNRVLKAEGLKWIRAACDQAGDIVLAPAFVSAVGSFADGRIPEDLDIMFSAEADQAQAFPGIEHSVAAELAGDSPDRMPGEGMHPIWQPRGPQGRSIPMYDLVLRKRALAVLPAPEAPIPGPHAIAQGIIARAGLFAVEPALAGDRYLIEIDYDDARVLATTADRPGPEWIPDGLREALDSITEPTQAVLDLFWDGTTATAVDCLRHYSGDLTALPLQERLVFLAKAELGAVRLQNRLCARAPMNPGIPSLTATFEALGGRLLVRDLGQAYGAGEPWIEIDAGEARPDGMEIYHGQERAMTFLTEEEQPQEEAGKPGQRRQAAAANVAKGLYEVRQPAGRTFPFVVQVHYRGLPPEASNAEIEAMIASKTGKALSAHTDIRMETPAGHLVGWTLFTPGNSHQENKLLQNGGRRIQATPKLKIPPAWLRVAGRVQAGKAGATVNTDAWFDIVARGRMTYGTAKPGFYEYFLKFAEPALAKLNGRWIVVKAPIKASKARGATAGGYEREVYLMSRPQDQRPYLDTHKPEDKAAGEIWQYEPVPGLDIPKKDDQAGRA